MMHHSMNKNVIWAVVLVTIGRKWQPCLPLNEPPL